MSIWAFEIIASLLLYYFLGNGPDYDGGRDDSDQQHQQTAHKAQPGGGSVKDDADFGVFHVSLFLKNFPLKNSFFKKP